MVTDKQLSWDRYFLEMAVYVGSRSSCLTRKVGCVLTKDNRVLATGYCGTPSGMTNCNDGGCQRCQDRIDGKIKSGEERDRCWCLCAEQNVIAHCALYGINPEDSTIYLPIMPCINCALLLISCKMGRIVSMGGLDMGSNELLKESNIEVYVTDNVLQGA